MAARRKINLPKLIVYAINFSIYPKKTTITHRRRSLPQIEVDHARDGVDLEHELALLLAHLAELEQQAEVLRQVAQVLPGAIFHLVRKIRLAITATCLFSAGRS